jgi:tetratricopeptide (TPR) repeat protein
MKTKQILKVLPVMFTLTAAFGQTAAERLEQGVQLQSAEGDIEGAIAEYKAVLKAAAKSQRLAAEARYRLAECFSQLGNVERMKDHLKALREDFPADNKWVQKAVSMAPKDWAFEGTPWQDGAIHTYEVRIPNGEIMGHFILATRLLEESTERWESIAIRSAGMRSLSRTIFQGEEYQSQSARWYLENFGDISMSFEKGGKVKIVDTETGADRGSYDHSKSPDPNIPMFENEQAIQILRALKQEVGTKQKTIICAGHNSGMPISFDLEVTDHVEIEVAAGKFSCAKIETSIKQTFYVSRGENRELVRMDMGAAKIDLAKTESWNREEPKKIRSREFGATIILPGTMLHSPPNVDKEVYRVQLWASDFAGTTGLLEINKKSNLVERAQAGSRDYAKVLHEGFATNFDEFEVSPEWDEIGINRVTAVGMKVKAKKGEVIKHAYQVHAVGDDTAMSFRLEYAKPDEEKAIARAKEIVEKFRW